MKILVLGCKGQLGLCLNDQLINTDYEVIYTSRKQINVVNFDETKKNIFDIAPDVVINSTAFTAVDMAEKEHEEANLLNHLAVRNIANICKQLDCWLIHISTDYVFDGCAKSPYKETDLTNPLTIYGKTKLHGEMGIGLSGCKYIIVRTSWVFSEHGSNFLLTMLKSRKECDELKIVQDQIGCPTYAQDIAKAILVILSNLQKAELNSALFHYCGAQSCSWYTFAKEIFHQALEYGIPMPAKILPTPSSEFFQNAVRPKYSVLNTSKINAEFGIKPSDWKSGIASTLRSLNS